MTDLGPYLKARVKRRMKSARKKSIVHEQFKCRSCEKRQHCYGSRYCMNEFCPVSLVQKPSYSKPFHDSRRRAGSRG